MTSAWTPRRCPSGSGAPEAAPCQDGTVLLEDKLLLGELNQKMMGKVNNMMAFLQQTLSRERGKHASNISMIMRKVDKDLKDTFKNVRETFAGLTGQLTQLVREVENGHQQVRAIQAKYTAAKEAAQAQAQYVAELETVLDSQGSGLSEMLRKLSDQNVTTHLALEKATQEGRQRVLVLQKENKEIKAQLRRYVEEEKELMAGKEPAALPEMTASWTRHLTSPAPARRTGDSTGSCASCGERSSSLQSRRPAVRAGPCDIVASMMVHCDAKRAAPRTKLVHPQTPARASWPLDSPRAQQPREEPRNRTAPATPTPPAISWRLRDEEVTQLRRHAESAELRCKKQQRLMAFAAGMLSVLREIFLELRQNRCLTATDEPGMLKKIHPAEAAGVVDRIVQLFSAAIPQLGDLAEVIAALSEEAAGPSQDSLGGRATRAAHGALDQELSAGDAG